MLQVVFNDIQYDVHPGDLFEDRVWRIYPSRADLFPPVSGKLKKNIKDKAKALIKMSTFSLGTLSATTPQPEKMETTMSYDYDCDCCAPTYVPYPSPFNNKVKSKDTAANASVSINAPAGYSSEQEARNHLLQRLSGASYDKYTDLRKAFNIDEVRPSTLKELVDAIKNDKFKVELHDFETEEHVYDSYADLYYNPFRRLTWMDPAKPKDEPGFSTANKAREDGYVAAKDTIMIMDLQTGLKALQDFEANTFH